MLEVTEENLSVCLQWSWNSSSTRMSTNFNRLPLHNCALLKIGKNLFLNALISGYRSA